MVKRMIEGIEIESSSGNVFADLGLPDAEKLKKMLADKWVSRNRRYRE